MSNDTKHNEIDIYKGKGYLKDRIAKAERSSREKKKYKKTSAIGMEQYGSHAPQKTFGNTNPVSAQVPDRVSDTGSTPEGKNVREIREVPAQITVMEDLYDYVTDNHEFMVVDDNLYVYKEDRGFWKLIVPNDNNRELRKLLPCGFMGRVTKSTLSELHEWLLVYSNRVYAEDLKKSRNYINFRNLAYNVKDDSFTDDRKNLYFRYSLAIDYCGEEESSGEFKNFIETALDHDKKTIREFRKFFALCLSNCRGLRNAFFLYGPSGTSKSTVERVLWHTIGAEHCVSLSFSQLSNDFATATLHGKHLSISGEISDMGNKKFDIFKSITGDDLFSSNFKGRDYFTLENRSVLVFATNVLPKISNQAESEAMISRMVIFPFTHVVKRSECVNEYWMTLMQDIPGIVEFAIKGFKDLREDNFRFHDSDRMEQFKKDYAGENDSFSMFAKEMLESDTDSRESSENIEKAYSSYCKLHDYVPMDKRKWSLLLKRMFPCRGITMPNPSKDTRIRGYKGVRLNEKAYKLMGTSLPEDTVTPADKTSSEEDAPSDLSSLNNQIAEALAELE